MKKWLNITLVAVLCIALLLSIYSTFNHEGYKVSKITDGDTIHAVDKHGTTLKIRLLHIDAPETTQAFGKEAKEHLGDKIMGCQITLEEIKPDKRYPDRTLGVIYFNGRNINLEMVADGYAWHYAQFSPIVTYEDAEKQARKQRLGLWQGKTPLEPWEYRKKKMLERLQKNP